MRTCQDCHAPVVGIKRLCAECRLRRRRESNRLVKLTYAAAGTCRDCGGELATTLRCRPCQDKRNAWYRRNRERTNCERAGIQVVGAMLDRGRLTPEQHAYRLANIRERAKERGIAEREFFRAGS